MTTRIAITSSLFLGLAMLLIPSAQAMSPPPLHQSDGISTEARYRGVGVARGYGGYRHYGYGVRRYGYGGYRHYGYNYGYRAYGNYGYRHYGQLQAVRLPALRLWSRPWNCSPQYPPRSPQVVRCQALSREGLGTPTLPVQCVS